MAELRFTYGAMKSGKSLNLVARAYNHVSQGHDIVTIKPAIEERGGDAIFTRAGLTFPADILSTPDMDLRERVRVRMGGKAIDSLSHIFVDEAEILEPNQIDQLHALAKAEGVPVTAFGLRTNFRTELFQASKRLFEIADTFERFESKCVCKEYAEFNCRSVDGQFVFEGPEIAIDGVNGVSYEPLCGTCYFRERDKFDKITTAEA